MHHRQRQRLHRGLRRRRGVDERRRDLRTASYTSEVCLLELLVDDVLRALGAIAFAKHATPEQKRAAEKQHRKDVRRLTHLFKDSDATQAAVRAAARRDDGPSSHQLRARNTALPRNGHAAASAPSLARSDGGADGEGPGGADADDVIPLTASPRVSARAITFAFQLGRLLRLLPLLRLRP